MSENKEATKDTTNDHDGGLSAPGAGSEDQKAEVLRQIAETLGTCEPSFLCELLSSLQAYKKHPKLFGKRAPRQYDTIIKRPAKMRGFSAMMKKYPFRRTTYSLGEKRALGELSELVGQEKVQEWVLDGVVDRENVAEVLREIKQENSAAVAEKDRPVVPVAGKMTLGRAREIVAAMVGHVCWEVGAMETKPQSLADLSLAEMVEANRIVCEIGAVEIEAGAKEVRTVCEDRLIAALYVLYHYEPDMTNHPIVHDGQKLVDVLPVERK